MPRTKKPKAKPRQRTCLNIQVSPSHLEILKLAAAEKSQALGQRVTKSEVVRDLIWTRRDLLNLPEF